MDKPYSEPSQSPIYHARNANRYDRQALIQRYEAKTGARLVVVVDHIYNHSITYLEELIYDCDVDADLHMMLQSPGGDGEVAVRLVRSAQAHCRELTIIVPDQAKSAATLLALGAHHILMAAASDLGPIDPQLFFDNDWVAAKDVIAAVEHATQAVQESPATYPIHAAILGGVTAFLVQQARSALARSQDLLKEALRSHPGRTDEEVEILSEALRVPLIDRPQSHAAIFSADNALEAGLPVEKIDPKSDSWQMLWRLWTKYFILGPSKIIYENGRVSQIFDMPEYSDQTEDSN